MSISGKLIAVPRSSNSQFCNTFLVTFDSSGTSSIERNSPSVAQTDDEDLKERNILHRSGQWVIVVGLRPFEGDVDIGVGCNVFSFSVLSIALLPKGYDLLIKTGDLHFSSSGQTRCAMARFCTPCWHCGQAGSTSL
jgi:hypothetical protein